MLVPCAQFVALVFLAASLLVLGHLHFLAPYKAVLLHAYWVPIGAFLVALYVNVLALVYVVVRHVTLSHTGQHLQHVERQLRGSRTVNSSLRKRLNS